METTKEDKAILAKAIIAVMKEVKGIEKSVTVGTGNNAYKGVADKDVKDAVGEAMSKAGLCIIPIGVESKVTIERWEELDTYSKEVPKPMKVKQSVLTEVLTKYLLVHDSGASIEFVGSGHGVDSQDKSIGKATTYALKYALLYLFMIPTGKIDDADKEHSDDKKTPPAKQTAKNSEKLGVTKEQAEKMLRDCKTLDVLKKTFLMFTPEMQEQVVAIKEELKTSLTPKK